MWETWREEMRHWGQPRWREWFDDRARRVADDEERSRQVGVARRRRLEEERRRLGIDEKDVDRRRELFRQDRERHPETRELWKEWEQRRTVREHEVLAYPTLTLRRHADLRPDDTSPPVEPLTVGFGALGDAVALWPGSNEGGEGVVSRHGTDGRWNDRTPLSSRSPRGHVQPLPDGEVLFVDARCRRDEHNAAVYDESGRVLRTAHVGDGIEHVLTTAAGAVWTAYFDEGVFAMRGLSTHGLVRFGSDLSPQWLYPQARQTDLPVISDCYALNVAGEAAWTCAYVDFHLVNVDDARAVDHGPAPVSGASGLLVEGAQAALIGASAGGRGVVTPVHLTDDGLRLAGPPRRLVLPDGAPVPTLQFARFTCRGPELHVAIGATWYRFDLDDVPTS